jgi:2-dehydropantoate 2-reductase
MRILVVGAGGTGGYFGARLAQAGRDVTFLVRPKRAAQLRADGLVVMSPHGDLTLRPQLVTAGEIAAAYDVVLLTVKAFGLEAALEDVAPAVGTGTVIVPTLNGMRHIDLLKSRFGDGPVLGGVCLVAAMQDQQGRVVQLTGLQELTYGEWDGSASARVAALDATMQGAGFTARASTHIVQEMWEKWVTLAALGGITCLLRGTVGEIVAAPGGADLARQLLAEAASIAAASGYQPGNAPLARAEAMLTQAGSNLASSMYRDLNQGFPVEVEQIIGDLLARARRLGVAAPLLAAAYAHLSVYQRRVTGG